ncbi:opacity family porin [Lonepinella sp. BR2271]|uniref:opacity family porin n=1 Tax=Lonepinella sp. BR2271 TaxID=3434550 RepID=UPI003F6E3B55
MKKTTLAIMIGAFAFATSASASNWYVQGDLGYSKTKFTSYSSLNDSKFEPGFSLGYDFGDFRLAADYTHHGKFSGNVNSANGSVPASAKIYGVGVSAFYDINLNNDIKPYVGVRVASNIVKYDQGKNGVLVSSTEAKLGYGAIVGAQYKLDTNWAVNGGIEYNRLGSYEDTNVNNYGAKVGIRYSF